MVKTIAFIPARGGSKSIPKKNIKRFCGKPLIYWVIKELSETKSINEIVVATDSSEIKNVVVNFNFSKVTVYNRDKKNAVDTATTESVMLEYIKHKNLRNDYIFMLVQATSPFTRKFHFEEALKQFSESHIDSLLSCSKIKRFFWDEKGQALNYDYTKRPRRQDFKGQLTENGAFYINTVGNIKKYKNRLSGNISIYEMPEYAAVEIDEEEDWLIAEKLMYKHILKFNDTSKIKLFLTDVDGVLTDAGMYYSEKGDELKKFNTKDGKAFELLRNSRIKTGVITSELTKIVVNRAKKLQIDYVFQGINNKLEIAKEICKKENISLEEVSYIGDDVNDIQLLKNVGFPACPNDAVKEVKNILNIHILESKGGNGCVREFYDWLSVNPK